MSLRTHHATPPVDPYYRLYPTVRSSIPEYRADRISKTALDIIFLLGKKRATLLPVKVSKQLVRKLYMPIDIAFNKIQHLLRRGFYFTPHVWRALLNNKEISHEDAKGIFLALPKRELNVFVFNVMIKNALKTNDSNYVTSLFHKIKEEGILPDDFTYAMLDRELCKNKAVVAKVYAILIHWLCEIGQAREAFNLYEQMEEKRIPITDLTALEHLVEMLNSKDTPEELLTVWNTLGRLRREPTSA
jgi:pentatricopeptide repeat protein